jgi:excisionase family DNA binding protein
MTKDLKFIVKELNSEMPPESIDAVCDLIIRVIEHSIENRRLREWPRWMDYKTAGEYLCCSSKTISRLVRDGALPFSKIRSKRYLDRNNIDKLLERKQTRLKFTTRMVQQIRHTYLI